MHLRRNVHASLSRLNRYPKIAKNIPKVAQNDTWTSPPITLDAFEIIHRCNLGRSQRRKSRIERERWWEGHPHILSGLIILLIGPQNYFSSFGCFDQTELIETYSNTLSMRAGALVWWVWEETCIQEAVGLNPSSMGYWRDIISHYTYCCNACLEKAKNEMKKRPGRSNFRIHYLCSN